MKYKSIAFCMLLATALHLSAADSTWVGTSTTWNTAGNWDPSGVPASDPATSLFFDATAANFTIANNIPGGIQVGSIELDSATAYTISGNTITLPNGATVSVLTGSQTFSTDFALSSGTANFVVETPLTISGVVSGNGGIAKTGAGTFTLNNNNYTGGTSLSGGSLGVVTGSLGTGALTVTTGELIAQASANLSNNIVLNGDLAINQNGNPMELTGTISSTGGIFINGGGEVTLTGTNTFQNGVTINAGAIVASSDANLGASTGTLTIGDGQLLCQNGFNFNASRPVVSSGIGSITINSNVTLASISGAGALSVNGNTATFQLTGANTCTNGSVMSDGNLLVSSDSALGATGAPLTLTNNGFLQWGGDFSVAAGRAVTLGSGCGFDTQSNTGSILGNISGVGGSLLKRGSGKLTLAGTNSYDSGTFLVEGTLAVGGDANLGADSTSITTATATLQFTGNGTIATHPIAIANVQTCTIDTQGFTGTVSSVISGVAGALNKAGSGTLVLSNTNTYASGTTISAGNLNISSDANLGDTAGGVTLAGGVLHFTSSLTLNAGRSVSTTNAASGMNVDNGVTATVGNNISGSGSLIKTGAGQLTLSGSSNFSGTTQVNAGTVLVSGSLSGGATVTSGLLQVTGTVSGTTTVGASGTLKGNGTVATGIINGILQPGNSIGTITGDNFTFNNGSSLEVELNDAGQTDLVVANNSVTINSGAGVLVIPAAGTYTDGQTFTIIQSPLISGTFTSLNQPFAGLTASLVYLSDRVNLVLAEQASELLPLLPRRVDGNTIATARYFDHLQANNDIASGSDLETVFTALSNATPTALASGLDTMHPAPYNALSVAQQETSLYFSDLLHEHLDDLRTLGCHPVAVHGLRAWAEPFGSIQCQDSIYGQVGYEAKTGGVALGVDQVERNFAVGFAGGYAYSSVQWGNLSNGAGYIQSGYGALYGRYLHPLFYTDLSFAMGYNRTHANRGIYAASPSGNINRQATSSFNGLDCTGHMGVGSITRFSAVDFSAFIACDGMYSYQDAFTEKGANSLNLGVQSHTGSLVRGTLGFSLSQCYSNWSPKLTLATAYERHFGSRIQGAFVNEPGTLTVYGIAPNRWLFLPGLQISGLFLQDRLVLEAGYDAELAASFFGHYLSAGATYRF